MKALERDLGSLDRLIDEMLTYARLERPEMPLNPVDLELGAWVHLYLADWQTLAPEKTLQLEVRSDPIPWHGDERLLARAVENLVSNALRHANHQVTLTLERQHDVCLIRVQDDGPGIAPEHAARVFEPFVRLDESRDRRTGGTGLGLAIVRSIARHHGGDVVLLESESGAHFCIRLPAPQF